MTYREDLNRPLSKEEVDANFKELANSIKQQNVKIAEFLNSENETTVNLDTKLVELVTKIDSFEKETVKSELLQVYNENRSRLSEIEVKLNTLQESANSMLTTLEAKKDEIISALEAKRDEILQAITNAQGANNED